MQLHEPVVARQRAPAVTYGTHMYFYGFLPNSINKDSDASNYITVSRDSSSACLPIPSHLIPSIESIHAAGVESKIESSVRLPDQHQPACYTFSVFHKP